MAGGNGIGQQSSMFTTPPAAFPPLSDSRVQPQQQFLFQQPRQSQFQQRSMDGRPGVGKFGQLLPAQKYADPHLLDGINIAHVGSKFTVDESVKDHYSKMYSATFCALQFKLLRQSTPECLKSLSETSLKNISGLFGKAFACCLGGKRADLTVATCTADDLADNHSAWVSYLLERYINVYMSGGALVSNGLGREMNDFIKSRNEQNLPNFLIPSSYLFKNMVKRELNITSETTKNQQRLDTALKKADAIVEGFDMQTWLYYIQRDLWIHGPSNSKTGITTLIYDETHLYPDPRIRSKLIERVSKKKPGDVSSLIGTYWPNATSQRNPDHSKYWFQSALPRDLNSSRPSHVFPASAARQKNAESEQTGSYRFKSKEEIDEILTKYYGCGDLLSSPPSSPASSPSPSSSGPSRSTIGLAQNTGAPQSFGTTGGGFPSASNNNTSGLFSTFGNGSQGQPQQGGFPQFGQNGSGQPGGNQFPQGLNSRPSTFDNGGSQPSQSFGTTGGGFPSMSNNNTSGSFSTFGNGFQGQPQQN